MPHPQLQHHQRPQLPAVVPPSGDVFVESCRTPPGWITAGSRRASVLHLEARAHLEEGDRRIVAGIGRVDRELDGGAYISFGQYLLSWDWCLTVSCAVN